MKSLLVLLGIILLAGVLRFYNISSLPNGLHWDEQDTGYQAYSVIHTGRDYFGNPLPVIFHSFADFRTPVFIYSAVPSVYVFGLTPFAVRLPSAIFGVLSVLLIYYLANLMFPGNRLGCTSLNIGHLASFVLAISPWHIQYGRQSVECNVMLFFILLGLITFYKSLKNSSWFWLSGLSFGLAVASYSPAKFFVPLLVLCLIWIYKIFPIKFLIIVGLISLPFVYDGAFGQSATRFHDVSILTDPTIASAVDYERQYSNTARGQTGVGQSPDFLDKLTYNKFTNVFGTFTNNYLDVFSTQYLFTRGDQELRHSPNENAIGQFHMPDILPFILGLFALASLAFVSRKVSWVMGFWFVIGPVASALTRGGGAHAARTFLMLPAFVLTISLGSYYLFTKIRLVFWVYFLLLAGSCLMVFNYFFGIYRLESARPFQWGFDQAINLAIANSPRYNLVVVDLKNDSPLMAYLFTTKLSPAKFQSLEPLPTYHLTPEVSGNKFGNILLLSPGSRTWTDIIHQPKFPSQTLIISEATQPLINTQVTHIQTVLNPDQTPFLYLFSTN